MIKKIKSELRKKYYSFLIEFLNSQSFGGFLLIACTVISLLLANSSVGSHYTHFWHQEYQFNLWFKSINANIEFIVNDVLMCIFFLLVGIEIKREIIIGELSTREKLVLPLAAAIGGMLVPAFIYNLFNHGNIAQHGWGIPMATDIAFALGVLSLLGNRVPIALKVFLTALAVIDDLGAIIVIALFYSSGINLMYALLSLGVIIILLLLNKLKVNYTFVYLILGGVLWFTVYQTGVHSTIAGVLLAFTLPTFHHKKGESILLQVGHAIHLPVTYFIMPLFAMVNTAILINARSFEHSPNALFYGIAAGLFFGKPIGILLFSFISVKLKWAVLPQGTNWNSMVGVGILSGIGFTMSVFITILAFDDKILIDSSKIIIMLTSLIAALTGLLWLTLALKNK